MSPSKPTPTGIYDLRIRKRTLATALLACLALLAGACGDDAEEQPNPPPPLALSAPVITAVIPETGSIRLSWRAGRGRVAGYELNLVTYASDGSEEDRRTEDLGNPSMLVKSLDGLLSEKTYEITMAAYDSGGAEASSSPSARVSPLPPSSLPTPVISSSEPIGDGIHLLWTLPATQMPAEPPSAYTYEFIVYSPERAQGPHLWLLDDNRRRTELGAAKIRGLREHGSAALAVRARTGSGDMEEIGAFSAFSPLVEPLEACGGAYVTAAVSEFSPALPNGPHAGVLRQCLLGPVCSNATPCTTGTLPLIGQESARPDITTIMNHVLVQQPWMADRFREVLEFMGEDGLLLFRSMAGVIIGDIRPSFFWSLNAAIHLDAYYFATASEHRLDVDNITRDFRSDFSNGLQFRIPWYISIEGDLPGGDFSDEFSSNLLLTSLIAHEAAHALDFLPPSTIPGINRSLPVVDVRASDADQPSSHLQSQYPLTSQLMYELAEVAFHTGNASDSQKALLPGDIALEFPPDGATVWYNYSTQYEDFAMLTGIALEWHLIGAQNLVAITTDGNCRDAIPELVSWGRLNRILEPHVRVRAELALRQILPEEALDRVTASLDNMPSTRNLLVNSDFCNPDPQFEDDAATAAKRPEKSFHLLKVPIPHPPLPVPDSSP